MDPQPQVALTVGQRVLGIDPGLNITGYGVLEVTAAGLKLCEAGVVRGKTKGSLTARLHEIHSGVSDVIRSLSPHVVALEQLYSHYARPRTAILMGHARGVICLSAAQAGLPIQHYSATQVKRILTGSGHAPKTQIQHAIQQELRLAAPPDPPDVADALAIALCHYYLARQNLPQGTKVKLPQAIPHSTLSQGHSYAEALKKIVAFEQSRQTKK